MSRLYHEKKVVTRNMLDKKTRESFSSYFRLTLGMQKRKVLKQKLLRGVYEYKKETIPFVEIYKTL